MLSGKYRLLERDAAKTAIDLNLAAHELKAQIEEVAQKEQAHETRQLACYELEEQLTGARQQLSDSNVEAERTRGQLAAQVKESGAIEQRIAQAEKETQELGVRLDRLDEEISAHRQNLDALEAQTTQSRSRMLEINQQRDALQNRLREREKAIESGRQLILRLLGEASTLKNQLAQIEEYLAGIEREKARSAREEQVATAEIERLEAARKQVSETVAQRQLELETVVGERRRTEEELAEQRNTAAEVRREIDGSEERSFRDSRAQGIARTGAGAPHLHHRIGETAVRGAGARQGGRPAAHRGDGGLRGSGPAV